MINASFSLLRVTVVKCFGKYTVKTRSEQHILPMLINSEQRVFRAFSKIGKQPMRAAFCEITRKQGFYCRGDLCHTGEL